MVGRLLKTIVFRLGRIRPGTVRELKANSALGSISKLVHRTGSRRDRDISEQEYSQAAGYTIAKIHTHDVEQYSWIDGELRRVTVKTAAKAHYRERNRLLSDLSFETVLEVGAGELTSLYDLSEAFGHNKHYFGLDITLNRLLHGRSFVRSRGVSMTVCQADGSRLPFPDNSFDLVYTSHSLEQMPTIFSDAIREMIRVSRRHIVMFEPAYEGVSLLQKLHIRGLDYARTIEPFLRTLDGVRVHKPYLLQNTINPFNRSTMFRLEKPEQGATGDRRFICPVSRGELQQLPDGYYSADSRLFYPIIRGIPVLYRKYAQLISPEIVSAE